MLLEEGRLDLQVLGQGNKLQAVAARACYGGILSSSSVSEDCVKCLSSSPASSSQLFLGSTASINDNDSIGAIVRFAAVESPGRLSSSPESSSNSSSCCTASFSDCTNIHPTITLSPTTIEAMSNSMTSSSSNPAGRDRKGSLNMAMTADYSASSSSTNWWNNILMPSPSETGHPHLFLNSQQASPEPADEDSALPDQSSAWYQVLLQNQHSGVSNGLQDILCSQNDLPFQPELGSRISTANMQTWEEQQQQQQPPPMAVSNFTFNGNDMNLPMNSSCSHKSNLVTAYPYHQSSQSFTTTMAMDNNHNWQTSVKLTTPTTEANLATTFNESKMVSLNKSRLSVPCTAFSGGILTDFVGFPRQVKQDDHSNFIYNTNESKHGLLDSSNIITRWPLPLGFPNTPNSSQVFGLGGSNINYNLPLESKLLRSICHEAPTVAMDRNQAANQRDFKPSSNGIRNSTMQGEEIMQNSQHRMIPCDDSPLALKRQRLEPSTRPGINVAQSSKPPVRKEKLGDRISALQQLVSPFGKTDTASVLLEAMSYIRFLHEQVQVLSTPYIKSPTATNATSQTESGGKNKEWGSPSTSEKSTLETGDEIEPKHDLRSRGLCLVPVSCTMHVANEFGSDYWAPPLGGRFR